MRKYIVYFMFFSILSLFSGCDEEPKEVKVLTLASSYSPEYVNTEAIEEFARLVSEKSDGLINIEIYTNSEIGTDENVLESVCKGDMDFAFVSFSAANNISDIPGKTELPYLFRDSGHMYRAVETVLGPNLDSSLIGKGAKTIAYMNSGAVNLITKNPVNSPDDLRGLKIRTSAVSKFSEDFIPLIGAKPVNVNIDSISSAVDSGEIDGAEATIVQYYNSGCYKSAKNLLKVQYRYVPDIIIINNLLYQNLEPAEQDIIISAANEAGIHQRDNFQKYESEIEKKLEAEGCVITEPSEELNDFLRQESNIVYKRLPYDDMEVPLISQVRATK